MHRLGHHIDARQVPPAAGGWLPVFDPATAQPYAVGNTIRPGRYVPPTRIEGPGPDCATHRVEIFGPVATLRPFDDEDHALAPANASDCGLVASVWTCDLARAQRLAVRLRTRMGRINARMPRDLRMPFGRIGRSGPGREGGLESMRFFTESRNAGIAP